MNFFDLIKAARDKGQHVIFDPNIRLKLWKTPFQMRDAIKQGAVVSNLVLPSFSDEQNVFGDLTPNETTQRYLSLGCKEVIVKNGAEGILYRNSDGEEIATTPKRILPTDTTGAGDSFNAGFIYAKSTRKSTHDAVNLAQVIASCVIQKTGAIVKLPKSITEKF